jgi:hypothetical protein
MAGRFQTLGTRQQRVVGSITMTTTEPRHTQYVNFGALFATASIRCYPPTQILVLIPSLPPSPLSRSLIHMYIHTHTYAHIHTHTYIRTHTYAHIHTHTYIRTHTYAHVFFVPICGENPQTSEPRTKTHTTPLRTEPYEPNPGGTDKSYGEARPATGRRCRNFTPTAGG